LSSPGSPFFGAPWLRKNGFHSMAKSSAASAGSAEAFACSIAAFSLRLPTKQNGQTVSLTIVIVRALRATDAMLERARRAASTSWKRHELVADRHE